MDNFFFRKDSLYTKRRGGYITLLSVLVIGAIGAAIAGSVILLGIGSSRSAFVYEQSVGAQTLADTCVERALQHMHDSLLCPSGETYTAENGSCTSVISGLLASCTIDAEGHVGNTVRRDEVIANGVGSFVSVNSWREIADY